MINSLARSVLLFLPFFLGAQQTPDGKQLVLPYANPLADIGNTRKIDAVVFGGRFFPRATLDRILSTAQTHARTPQVQ
jgi:hypothetical protein